jgi:hypothetical protein
MGSDPSPIRQVPAMWWSVVVMDLTKKSHDLRKTIVRVLNLRKRRLKSHNYIKLKSRGSAGFRQVQNSAGYGIPLVKEFRRIQTSAGKEFLRENFASQNSDEIPGHFYYIFKNKELLILHISRRICLIRLICTHLHKCTAASGLNRNVFLP